jgi:hypothetical protein
MSFFTRSHVLILIAIAIIFGISANIAWLNPNPSYVIKTNEHIPVMWQYNGDSTVEFLSAAYFPHYFTIDKTRTNRPGYPLAVKVLGTIFGIILWPFIHLGDLPKALLGYVTLKLIVYATGAICLYHLVRRKFSHTVALISVCLTFFHPFAVLFIGTFHTSELQFITPIFLFTFWLNLGDTYSHRKNILFSLLVGFLMLAKQNYAVYVAILIFSFFFLKKYKESILSFVIHFIPLFIWLIALKLLHIPYYNHEVDTYQQGVWLYKDLIFRNPLEILSVLIGAVNQWLGTIVGYFHILIFAAIGSLAFPETRSMFTKNSVLLVVIIGILSYAQSLAANRYAPYMSSDLVVIIIPFAAYTIFKILEKYRMESAWPILAGIYLALGLVSMIHFPWIHPYEQKNIISPDSVKNIDSGNFVPGTHDRIGS